MLILPAVSASADVNSDKATGRPARVAYRDDGAVLQGLVTRYDEAQGKETAVEAQLATTRAHLTSDRRAEARAMALVRRIAVSNYMNSGNEGPLLGLFDTGAMTSAAITQEYTHIATQGIDSAIDAADVDGSERRRRSPTCRRPRLQQQPTCRSFPEPGKPPKEPLPRTTHCSVKRRATCKRPWQPQRSNARLPNRPRRRRWRRAAQAAEAARPRRPRRIHRPDDQPVTGLLCEPHSSHQRSCTRTDRPRSRLQRLWTDLRHRRWRRSQHRQLGVARWDLHQLPTE